MNTFRDVTGQNFCDRKQTANSEQTVKGTLQRFAGCCLFFMLTCLIFVLPAEAATVYYVAPDGSDSNPGTEALPFLSLEKAQSTVRFINANMSSDIVVYLRGGTYRLSSTLSFDSRDSGTNGHVVTYMSYPNESAHVSGGQVISGWTDIGNGVYRASVGSLRFRQFYVNGVPGTRARTPNAGTMYRMNFWDSANDQAVINSNEIADWERMNEVEMIFHTEWRQNNLHISSYEELGGNTHVRVTAQEMDIEPEPGQPYYFENAYEFLDEPGEWYLDSPTGLLFYSPRPGEDLSQAVVTVPVLERLLQFQGTLSDPVRNIEFYGITFEESNWTLPDSAGFRSWLGDVLQAAAYLPGAIYLEAANDLRFERNVFRNMGATAVLMYTADQRDTFIGNVFKDIAGSGIAIELKGDPIAIELKGDPTDPRSICEDIVIKDNYFTRVARDYHGSVAIFATIVARLVVEHNEIADLPYSGMSVGWGWTTEDSALNNNLIRYNRIHDVMKLLSDGAGVYTLSKQPGTLIAENYIYNVTKSAWAGQNNAAGIYLDEGSSYITVKNNVVEAADIFNFLHYASDNTIINAGLDNIYDYTPEFNTYIEDGTIRAAEVKADSGIEEAYQDILLDSTAPAEPANVYSISELGAAASVTLATASSPEIGYARIQPKSGSTALSALAILEYRWNNILISETTVSSAPLMTAGRLFLEVSPDGTVNTGVAIANPNDSPAAIDFVFTDSTGRDFGSSRIVVEARGQVAGFLSEPPYNAGSSVQGTFSFASSVPVSVAALRGLINERGELLMTALPVIDTSRPVNVGTQFLPHFADGSGWKTQILLVNPTDVDINGTVDFRDAAGEAIVLSVDGSMTNSAPYSIPRRSSQKLVTSGAGEVLASGSVRIVPGDGGAAPTPLVVFGYRPQAFTVSQAGVSPVQGTTFRMYVESEGVSGEIGNIQTGIAIANTDALSPVEVILQLFDMDGRSAVIPTRLVIPANAQTAIFLAEVFADLPRQFKGVLRISTNSSDIAVVGIRGRLNERQDFLVTTTPAIIENSPATFDETVLPHTVTGGGYTTRIILFSGSAGQSGSGNSRFFKQDGTPLDVTLN